MKIAIMQPYFFPYIGYFQLVNCVDKFIFCDDVNYIKKGWINRNRILMNGEGYLFTLSVKEKSQNKFINQIEICEKNYKRIKTIKLVYSKAPYFEDVFLLIQQVFEAMIEIKSISKISEMSVKLVSEYLGINQLFETSSEKYGLTGDHTRDERIITICQHNHADIYINPIGGTKLYCKDYFREKGIQLLFIKNYCTPYRQFNFNFISGLSIIDVMMFNDKNTIVNFLHYYELI